MRAIADEICARHGLTLVELTGPRQPRKIAHARFEFMERCREILRPDGANRYSTTMIGRFLGGRDHSTVVKGLKRWRARRMAEAA
jgi:chromosomal replication initiation ATPase DnaA